nr:hypothetical protein [Synechococcus sp. PCC 7336]
MPRGENRTPDFDIDGTIVELKTISGVQDTTSDGISGAIASRVMDGRGQAANIFVDATNQPGITQEIAERGVRRAFGADNRLGGRIQSITVEGPNFEVVVPRK